MIYQIADPVDIVTAARKYPSDLISLRLKMTVISPLIFVYVPFRGDHESPSIDPSIDTNAKSDELDDVVSCSVAVSHWFIGNASDVNETDLLSKG